MRMSKMHHIFLALFLLFTCATFAQSDGQVDTTFGIEGTAQSSFLGGCVGLSYALDQDNNIIGCGHYFAYPEYDFAVAKFDSIGNVDSSFANNGKFQYDFGLDDYPSSVLVQADNKIIVAGYSSTWDGFSVNSIFSQVSLIRLLPSGGIDSTFGNNGTFEFDFNPADCAAVALALQSDGKIIIIGNYYNGASAKVLVIRISVNGIIDASFGNNGYTLLQLDSTVYNDDEATSCVIQPDDKILIGVITRSSLSSGRLFGLCRLNANGSIDTSFGINGVVKTDIPNQGNDYTLALALQNDGKIIQAGSCKNSKMMALCRYNQDGSLDASFANQGIDTLNISGGNDVIQDLLIQDDGRIIVAGNKSSSACLLRLTQNGLLDTTFNHTGITLYGTASGEAFTEVLVMNPNKIIAAGYAKDTANVNQFTAVSYHSLLHTGIKETQTTSNEIVAYPNPAQQQINFTQVQANTQINIYNTQGQQILSATGSKSINISSLSQGLYLFTITNSKQELLYTGKFVKE
jgi:uncharacterized delta-60 repeat protein